MNRATRILAEWNTRVAACEGFTLGAARKNDEITALRAKLADKTRECTSCTTDSTRPTCHRESWPLRAIQILSGQAARKGVAGCFLDELPPRCQPWFGVDGRESTSCLRSGWRRRITGWRWPTP